ncbi:AbrB/MazE/SpoVT family DNA-binding domain-containing protein [Paucilactobacillus kaifaensis]|uniref:AbrB/MazE/SpoVT family DNA-binding domain-containing protein n=1 Tax=Paucilactobacillus kaifaensis TaxID=2559921 RepID=UPI0010F884FF|nr:type II toxin-antitoxin system PrlF family antitoxin [Paucilactobacillus kaifaensis]
MTEKNVSATVTSKNQVTIPKTVRDVLDIREHDKIVFVLSENGEVIVKREQAKDIWELAREQVAQYGSINTSEMDWGPDVGNEVID